MRKIFKGAGKLGLDDIDNPDTLVSETYQEFYVATGSW